ncbi:MAG: SAM-dependent methyltransferase [Microbacteriaceae bacterium]|nr:SAM-dependent methyltransferase [Microbacteriaceae bacterium]
MHLNCSVTDDLPETEEPSAIEESPEITELIDRLRADLLAARFGVDTLATLWGSEADAALHRGQRVPAFRALAALPRHSRAATLATVFVLGAAVPTERFAEAIPRLGLDGARGLRLVETAGDTVRPLVDLRPYSFVDGTGVGSWWIASDLGELTVGGALRVDHVLGVGGASTTLSGLMLGTPVEAALDLGTGCGIQAMHAARHAVRVVATDISQRALNFASFNARLNDIRNIEFRLGSLFEPVAGERFGHIVSNPPFVITPRTAGVPAYEYRDGGMVGDELVRSVVAGVAEHLAPGGTAQLLGNWEYRVAGGLRQQDGLDRVREWVELSDLDAWVVEREVQGAAAYAETWIRDGGMRPGPEFDRLYGAWLDDFEERGVDRIGFGYLTLRSPMGARRLRRVERLDGPIGSGLGIHIAESLADWDWQAGLSDEELGRTHLTVAVDVTEERHYWPGAEDPTVMTLRQGGAFGRTVKLDTGLAALVGACDGELSVRAIIAAIAELLEVDQSALASDLLPRVRDLVVTGFLRRR